MSDQCAYKTTDAEVIAYFDELTSTAWSDSLKGIAAQFGLPDDVEIMAFSGERFAGFYSKSIEESCARLYVSAMYPKGWRWSDTRWVPDKRTKVGKAAAAAIKAVGHKPSVRGLPGMVPEVWVSRGDGSGRYTIVYPQAFLHDGVAYVLYDAPRSLVEDADARMSMGVPDGRWEPIRLSEYHSVREEREAVAS